MFVFLESDAQHSFHLHKLLFNHKDYNVFENFTNFFKVSKLSKPILCDVLPPPPPLKKEKGRKILENSNNQLPCSLLLGTYLKYCKYYYTLSFF